MRPALALATAIAALPAVAPPAAAQQPAPAPAPACCTVTVRALVPAGTGILYLAGSLPALGPWRPDGLALSGSGRERTARLTVPRGTAVRVQVHAGLLGPRSGRPCRRGPSQQPARRRRRHRGRCTRSPTSRRTCGSTSPTGAGRASWAASSTGRTSARRSSAPPATSRSGSRRATTPTPPHATPSST